MAGEGQRRMQSDSTTKCTRWAITRRPGPELADCELTHLARGAIDLERAREQHAGYRAALERAGCRLVDLPELPGHADAPFVEDPALVLDELAVLPVVGAESRRGEQESLAQVLAEHRELVRMQAPTTLDGGDVLYAGDTLYVGWSRRTNHAGLKALAHLVLPYGYGVKAVEVKGCLHLKTALTALDPETLLAHRRWVNLERARGQRVLEVDPSEPFAANVLRVGTRLFAAAEHPRTNERIRAAGFELEELELSEFAKAEAGLTCLSLVFEERAQR